ncbi:hypothetical protein XACLG97_10640009 [Xanthomonas citri pv. citri]|nr:hypothetical protein XACLG97_10640009 [Xanthomonas citri pv. citri]CEH39873.1 hypothetical protein XACG102_11060005 [Xanthomonas citri pv. citri]
MVRYRHGFTGRAGLLKAYLNLEKFKHVMLDSAS